MTTFAFTDDGDGYYETDIPDGEDAPEWTTGMTSCDVRPPPATTLVNPDWATMVATAKDDSAPVEDRVSAMADLLLQHPTDAIPNS